MKVLFVCTGNICRSPTAAGVFAHFVKRAGLESQVTVASAGTHDYHVGNPPDPRAQDHALGRPLEQPEVQRGDERRGDDQRAEDHDRPGERVVGGERLDHLARGERLRQPGGGAEEPEHSGHDQRGAVGADVREEGAHRCAP